MKSDVLFSNGWFFSIFIYFLFTLYTLFTLLHILIWWFCMIWSACCDVIFESDVNVVDILQEMCRNILKHHQIDSRVRNALSTDRLTPQGANLCRQEVLERCDIDLSTFLAEKERLGKSHKQVLEEIRSFNHSLCLKINFGVPFAQLGTPHLIRSFKPTSKNRLNSQ